MRCCLPFRRVVVSLSSESKRVEEANDNGKEQKGVEK